MKHLFTIILSFFTFNAQAGELIPRWTSTYSVGDGSVIYFDPQMELNGKRYYLAFSTMYWGDPFAPGEFCKMVVGPQSESNWVLSPTMRPEGEYLMMSFVADGTVNLGEPTTKWPTPEAVWCYSAEKNPNPENKVVMDIQKVNDTRAYITHHSYIQLPYAAEDDFFHGSPKLTNRNQPSRMAFEFDIRDAAHSATSICRFAGYNDYVSFEVFNEFDAIPNDGHVRFDEYGKINYFTFEFELGYQWRVLCGI